MFLAGKFQIKRIGRFLLPFFAYFPITADGRIYQNFISPAFKFNAFDFFKFFAVKVNFNECFLNNILGLFLISQNANSFSYKCLYNILNAIKVQMVGEPRIGLGLYAPKAYVLPLYYSPSSRLLYQKIS